MLASAALTSAAVAAAALASTALGASALTPAALTPAVLTPASLTPASLTSSPPLLLGTTPPVEASVAFRFDDPRIDESSGLATSSTGGLVYTHNDSGDRARFFAVGPDGRTRTTYVLPGVQARDWEDMARGPDEQGRSSLWLGDIGDNAGARDRGLLVHRVREPSPTDREQVTTEQPVSFRLRYRDGPGDAEALLVHPRTGRLHVVSKSLAGPAQVHAAPAALDPDGPNVLERVAEARVRRTGTPGGPAIGGLASVLVTAGDIAPDGSRVALRTYTDLYEWAVPGDDVAAAFAGEPTVTPLPPTEQGEGLAYAADGRSVLLSTEGRRSEVHRVVPRAPEPAPDPEPAPEPGDPEPAPDPGDPDPAPEPGAPDPPGAAADPSPSWPLPVAVGMAAVLSGAAVLGLLARRGARTRSGRSE